MNRRSFLPTLSLAAALLLPSSLPAKSGALTILKFEASWCGACQKMKPAFSAVAAKEEGVAFQSVDVDRQNSLAERYRIEALPTIVAVKNGREVGRLVGFQNAAKLSSFVKKHR